MQNGAKLILDSLYNEGITHFFMVPGKLINPFMSCYKVEESNNPDIIPIVAAHEEGAGFMADGYARASGRFGVCIVIGGPGATNAITPIAAAYTDRYPILLIAGQISHKHQLAGALQDSGQSCFNLLDMLKPVTNGAFDLYDVELLPKYLKYTFNKLHGLSRQPVFLSITQDALLDEAGNTLTKPLLPDSIKNRKIADYGALNALLNLCMTKSKIILLVGNHARSELITHLLVQVAEKFEIPVATSVSAKGTFPEDNRLALGGFGYMGSRRSSLAVLNSEPEIIIMLGYDVTQWNTMAWHPNFTKPYIVEVNSDQDVVNKYIDVNLPIVSDIAACLNYMLEFGDNALTQSITERSGWLAPLLSAPLHFDIEHTTLCTVPIHPAFAVTTLRKKFPQNTMVFVDSGAHRAFMGHYWLAYGPRDYFSTTTIGPMGWAIPAAIGGKIARPDVPCLVVTGDGCMLMHGVEIQTAARHNLDITFVVFNNSAYGQTYFNNKLNLNRLSLLPKHNFAKFAESLGVESCQVTDPEELEHAILKAMEFKGTYLIDVIVGHEYPAPIYDYKEQMSKLYRI